MKNRLALKVTPPGPGPVIDSAFSAILFPHVKKRSYSCVVFIIFILTFSNHTSNYPCINILCIFTFLLSYYLPKPR